VGEVSVAEERDQFRRPTGEPPTIRTIRVIVCAHIRVYREALAELLAQDEQLNVVGMTSVLSDAVITAALFRADVVVVDATPPGEVQAIRDFLVRRPTVRVVALTGDGEGEVIALAEAGAGGIVTSEDTLERLAESIRGAVRGDLVCSPQVGGALLRRVSTLSAGWTGPVDAVALTVRESQVVELIAEGLSNKEIAQRLCIEVPTVKHHVHHILEKLGVARRTEAVARARQQGLLRASG
jgi:DNA-binding NarL/FixJ family response regulator